MTRVHLLAMSPRFLTVVLLCLPALVSPVQAEEELGALPLEQLMGIPVVHAASKFEQLITEAPGAVVVLKLEDIRAFGWRTLADALATLPGMVVTNDRNYSYLGTRGILRPGDYNGRFILMIDGVRTNDAVYDQALIGSEGLIDMDMVQRIEFVPGAGSAVYGSNALLGVINVVTRDGNALSGMRSAAALGSEGERKLRASWGWHGRRGADLLLSASTYRRAGGDLYFPEFDQGDAHGGVAHGRDGDRARNILLKASYAGFTLTASHAHRTKQVPTGSFGAVFDTPNQTMDAQSMVQLAYMHSFGRGVTLATQLVWGKADYVGLGSYPDQNGKPLANVDGARARWHTFNTHATITRFAGHKIVLGADLEHATRRDQFNFNADPYQVLLDDRRSGNRHGVFIEDELRLGERLSVNASLRRDRLDDGRYRSSPRAALLYRASRHTIGKLVYGRAFRVPNAYEKYYSVDTDGGQMHNPALGPERIGTYEAVLEHALGNSGHARLSLFHYRAKDLITQQLDPESGALVFRNIDQARTQGVEASVELLAARAARVRASYGWQRGKDGKGATLEAMPAHLAKLNASAPLPGGMASAGGELLCMSRRPTGRGSVGGHCVANLSLRSARLVERGELSLSVYNLAGQRYADPGGPAFVQEAIVRPGRSAVVKLDYRF